MADKYFQVVAASRDEIVLEFIAASERRITFNLKTEDGLGLPNVTCIVTFSDGSQVECKTNTDGIAEIISSVEGEYFIQYPDFDDIHVKSCAARLYFVLSKNEKELLIPLLDEISSFFGKVSNTYSQYWNLLSGNDLVEDLQQCVMGSDYECIIEHYLARAGVSMSGTVAILWNANSCTQENSIEEGAVAYA